MPDTRFHQLCAGISERLPFGLERLAPPTFVGYLLVSAVCFVSDMALLTVLHSTLRVPLPIAITAGYITAFGLSYLLNRTLNFSSHAAVGPQLAIYVVVVVVNYLVFILGVSSGLATLGLEYQLARVVGGIGEGLYMYAAMRWLVFRGAMYRE
ncbi:GtrA family protein [Nocardia sp. NBC_01503]|uniref:GtrA family protein n=1 Tax=Nocardia sp. NBC_01503 TaxID=2975997 RepID=UPI002E7AD9DE|nr:GtrA family protein [Nocardia sp. NBC_01503]WTL32486.1 GtrA family protein [Nocardia sp. NBC_01503]